MMKPVKLIMITVLSIPALVYLSAGRLKAQELQVQVKPTTEYKSKQTRDPFEAYLREETEQEEANAAKPADAEKPLPSLVVQGIMWGGKFPQAVVNNRVVKAGDVIEGARVVDITKEGIIVFFENRQFNIAAPGTLPAQDKEKTKK